MEEDDAIHMSNHKGPGLEIGDSWHVLDDSDESEAVSIASAASYQQKDTSSRAAKGGGLGAIVEDSDWDEAEVLD